jgi:hypothetical protein
MRSKGWENLRQIVSVIVRIKTRPLVTPNIFPVFFVDVSVNLLKLFSFHFIFAEVWKTIAIKGNRSVIIPFVIGNNTQTMIFLGCRRFGKSAEMRRYPMPSLQKKLECNRLTRA